MLFSTAAANQGISLQDHFLPPQFERRRFILDPEAQFVQFSGQRRINLVRVHVDVGAHKSGQIPLYVAHAGAPRQQQGVLSGVVG